MAKHPVASNSRELLPPPRLEAEEGGSHRQNLEKVREIIGKDHMTEAKEAIEPAVTSRESIPQSYSPPLLLLTSVPAFL